MIKYLKYIIPLLFIFIGFNVNAKGIMIIQNGTPIETCTNCWEMSPNSEAYITNYRVIEDPRSFSQNDTYYFTALFETHTLGTSIDVTDCGLNINGSYVTPNTRNSYRVTNAQHGNIWTIRFQTEMTWQATSSLSNVPVFIQCDTSPQAQTNYVAFSSTISEDDTSTGQSIANQTRDLIDNNNQNSNMIGGKIDNNTNVIGGKLDSHANTITGKLQQIIDNLTNLGSNIISGISSTLQSVGSSITGKLQEFIGLQEVCDLFYSIKGTDVIYGEPYEQGILNSDATITWYSTYGTSPFLRYDEGEKIKIDYDFTAYSQPVGNLMVCSFNPSKQLNSCEIYYRTGQPKKGTFETSFTGNSKYIRYAFVTFGSYNNRSSLSSNCQKSGLFGLFNKFNSFVSNFFSNALGLNRIGSVLDRHKGILENSAFDGISSVINAPRQLLQSMNSYSCSNITTSVFNHNITLPSGCFFWERQDVSSFRAFWNLLFGGFLIYKFAYRLFKVLNDSLDPTKDDIGGLEV